MGDIDCGYTFGLFIKPSSVSLMKYTDQVLSKASHFTCISAASSDRQSVATRVRCDLLFIDRTRKTGELALREMIVDRHRVARRKHDVGRPDL